MFKINILKTIIKISALKNYHYQLYENKSPLLNDRLEEISLIPFYYFFLLLSLHNLLLLLLLNNGFY